MRLILYRCKQCLHSDLLCVDCIVEAHVNQPLHIVEQWETRQGFWRRVPLSKLGLIVDLGHGGQKCIYSLVDPREITVMHEQGLETVRFRFCRCGREGEGRKAPPVQLLEAGFWPGSWERTATAFTLEVMQEFELLSSHCHANPTDYCAYLRRRSDSTCPDDLSVRNLLFRWRQLTVFLIGCEQGLHHCVPRIRAADPVQTNGEEPRPGFPSW